MKYNNLQKYKKDLDELIVVGNELGYSLQYKCDPDNFVQQLGQVFKWKRNKQEKIDNFLKKLPDFNTSYQKWYSEALSVITQLLPDRVDDFINLYKKPKNKRKDITHDNYVIEDTLLTLEVSETNYLGDKKIIVDTSAGIPKFRQQIAILESVKSRFESSLFDIKKLVQADLFDDELDIAAELNKKGFTRAAGAVSGVVLEGHLLEVCSNHKITVRKKAPGINDLAQLLKKDSVIETPEWRKIQHLADLRNLCDHKKKKEPTKDDIEELIIGVSRIIKNIF